MQRRATRPTVEDTASARSDECVPQIRIFRHYVHTPFFGLGIAEATLTAASLSGARYWQTGALVGMDAPALLVGDAVFGVLAVTAMVALGVYEAQIREGFWGMMLRTGSSFFLLATMVVAVLARALPGGMRLDLRTWILAAVGAFVSIGLFRIPILRLLKRSRLKHRVLVLGAGDRATRLALRMQRARDQRGFAIVGYRPLDAGSAQLAKSGMRLLKAAVPLPQLCQSLQIHEVVVAAEERQRLDGATLPLEELMECRMQGVNVIDVQSFLERETRCLDVDLLQPSWLALASARYQRPWGLGALDGQVQRRRE